MTNRAMFLNTRQRKLLADGHALVASCPICGVDIFLGELPMDARDAARLCRRARCPMDDQHVLKFGPLRVIEGGRA